MSAAANEMVDTTESNGELAQRPHKEKLIDPNLVHYSPYNPPERVSDHNVRALAQSMSKLGLIYPVLVDPDNVLIEGHRRVAAARLLGWKTIRAYVMKGDRHRIYAEVNSTSKRMSGNDALGIWLQEPTAVTDYMSARFKSMEGHLGLSLVKKMHRAGLSLRAYNKAIRICHYCEQEPDFLPLVLLWFLECETLGSVQEAMARGVSPVVIIKAVRTLKSIKVRYES